MNYSAKAFRLKEDEYNYLLPALRTKLIQRDGLKWFSFISDNLEDLEDMLNRLKGLYDFYNDLPKMTIYNCSKNGSLFPFRDLLNIKTEY